MWGGVCEVNVGRELVPWQETSISILPSQMLCTTECITNLRIDYSSNVSFTTWDVHTKSTCVHCTLVASDKYILVPLFVYMYM